MHLSTFFLFNRKCKMYQDALTMFYHFKKLLIPLKINGRLSIKLNICMKYTVAFYFFFAFTINILNNDFIIFSNIHLLNLSKVLVKNSENLTINFKNWITNNCIKVSWFFVISIHSLLFQSRIHFWITKEANEWFSRTCNRKVKHFYFVLWRKRKLQNLLFCFWWNINYFSFMHYMIWFIIFPSNIK